MKTPWGKGEIARDRQFMLKTIIARDRQFLLFPQCFLPFRRTLRHFHQIQISRLQTLSVWTSLEFVVKTPLSTVLQLYHGDSSHYSRLPGFTSARMGVYSVLPKDTPTKKPRGSSAARTQDPWITSQILYH